LKISGPVFICSIASLPSDVPDSLRKTPSSTREVFIPDITQLIVQDLLFSKQFYSVTRLGGAQPPHEAFVCSPVLMVCSDNQSRLIIRIKHVVCSSAWVDVCPC
jgi:hypothetical protein